MLTTNNTQREGEDYKMKESIWEHCINFPLETSSIPVDHSCVHGINKPYLDRG